MCIRFGASTEKVAAGVGKRVRCFSEGLIELEDREAVSQLASGAEPLTVDGKSVDDTVTPSDEPEVVEPSELELFEHVGRIGIAPTYAAPVIGISRTDSPAFRAGLRTFDRITAVNGRKVETFVDLSRVLSQNRGDNVVLTYVRPVSVPR